jgi:hypothetical protein
VLAALAAGASFLLPRDRTEGMSGAAIAQAAGQSILKRDRYEFRAVLHGLEQSDVPSADMRGQYQRRPLVIHLEGEVASGSQRIALAYWLEENNLYVRDPRTGEWAHLANTNLDELHSFQPDNIATPLLYGVTSAQVAGAELVDGRPAVVLDLELDPRVMLPALGTTGAAYPSVVTYRLWVEQSSFLPLRFEMAVEGSGGTATASFTYVLEWEFGGRLEDALRPLRRLLGQERALEVPAAVREGAAPR